MSDRSRAGGAETSQGPSWPGVLALVGTLSLIYLPLFLGRILFTRDQAHWTFPIRSLAREALLSGRLPVWDPRQGLGFPVIADPLLGLFYPPNWLYLLPDPARVAGFDSLLHLCWGGAGVLLLARRFGARGPAALVGGLAWSLSGFMTGLWTAGLLLQASSWLPWCGLAGVRLARVAAEPPSRSSTARTIAVGALPVGAMLLQGEVFVAMMGVAFGLAMALVARVGRARSDDGAAVAGPWRSRFAARLLLLGALALALAMGLGAATLAPVRLAAVDTARAQPLSRALAERWSLHPLRVLEMVAPGSLGHPQLAYPGGKWIREPGMDLGVLSLGMYLGAAPLALALLAFGRGRPQATGLAVVGAASLLMALGRHTPFHGLVRRLVPPLALMRYPEKYFVIAVVVLALLAALGAERALVGDARRRRVAAWVVALAALAAGHGLLPREIASLVLPAAIFAAVAAALVLGALVLARRSARLVPLILPLVIAMDLGVHVFSAHQFVPSQLAHRQPPVVAAILAGAGTDPAPPRVFRDGNVNTTVGRFVPAATAEVNEARWLLTLVPNTPSVHGIASVPGYDAALPASWLAFFERGMADAPLATMRLAATGYALLPVWRRNGMASPPGLTPVMDPLPGSRLFRVERPLPRVYAAGRAEPVSAEALGARLREEDVLSGAVALVPADSAGVLPGAAGRAGACTLERHELNGLAATCRLDRPALVVFVEQHAAGWTAEVDGRPVPLLRVNGFMRGLRLPPGTHRIVMGYRAPGLLLGIGVSLLAALAAGALALAGRFRPGR